MELLEHCERIRITQKEIYRAALKEYLDNRIIRAKERVYWEDKKPRKKVEH